MSKTYLARIEIYYKITVSDNAKDNYVTEDCAAHSALESIHDYELYHINDDSLTQELKNLGCYIDRAEYYGRDYNTISEVKGTGFRSLQEQLNNQVRKE